MKNYLLVVGFLLALVFSGCSNDNSFKDNEDPDGETPQIVDEELLSVNDFIYSGLYVYYLYKSHIPVLADDYFKDDKSYEDFLMKYDVPDNLFDDLLSDQDRFSVIFPDFHELENWLGGIGTENGMDFGLVLLDDGKSILGYVRYVLPNSPAEEKGVQRGMLFNRIDGVRMTLDNYNDLLDRDAYEIGLVEDTGDGLAEVDQSIYLPKEVLHENPVYMHKVIQQGGHKIGYLMYNAFIDTYDEDLNNVFGDFKSEGITDLVVDLRYNGGGSVNTCNYLAGMITGQFEGKVFAKEMYNEHFKDDEFLFKNQMTDGSMLNSLNLNKVYVIATGSTASASELLINSLKSYIDVVHVGEKTVGKFQGSITLYHSEDFTRSKVKDGDTYAMQPLVLKLANADGVSDYVDGLTPDITEKEYILEIKELGNPDEPLLGRAIQDITGTASPYAARRINAREKFERIGESKMYRPTFQRMYKEGGLPQK